MSTVDPNLNFKQKQPEVVQTHKDPAEPIKSMAPGKTYLSPKYAEFRHSVNGGNQPSAFMSNQMMMTTQANQMLSPKYISTKPTLIKSSKYIVNKTEQSALEKQWF